MIARVLRPDERSGARSGGHAPARRGHPGEHPEHVCLIGPSRCGKSTVGIHLARRLGRPFFDGHPDLDDHLADGDGETRERADRVWFEGIVASTPASVIAVPASLLRTRPELIAGPGRQVVHIDTPLELVAARRAEIGCDDTLTAAQARRLRQVADEIADISVDGGLPVAEIVDCILDSRRQLAAAS